MPHQQSPQTPSAASRTLTLPDLFSPITHSLPIQDLLTATHISRAFLTNISSSVHLRSRLLSWRKMSLNELVLQDTESLPSGTVGSRRFEVPCTRVREKVWLFCTECEEEGGVLVTYRCCHRHPEAQSEGVESVKERSAEYFIYIPLSPSLPMHILHLSRLTFCHSTYTFTATWTSSSSSTTFSLTKSFDGKLLAETLRAPIPLHEDPSHMFSYLQAWYLGDGRIDWGRWAEEELGLKHGIDEAKRTEEREDGRMTWFQQWRLRKMGVGPEKKKQKRKEDVEVLEVKSLEMWETMRDPTFRPRHGHVRDGSQTDLELHLQNTYVRCYGKPVRMLSQATNLEPADASPKHDAQHAKDIH